MRTLWLGYDVSLQDIPLATAPVSQLVITRRIDNQDTFKKLPPMEWFKATKNMGSVMLTSVASGFESSNFWVDYLGRMQEERAMVDRLFIASSLGRVPPLYACKIFDGRARSHLWLCSRDTYPEELEQEQLPENIQYILLPDTLRTLWVDSFSASQLFCRKLRHSVSLPKLLKTLFICAAPCGSDPASHQISLQDYSSLFSQLQSHHCIVRVYVKLAWPIVTEENRDWTRACLNNLEHTLGTKCQLIFVPQTVILTAIGEEEFSRYVLGHFPEQNKVIVKSAPFIPHVQDCCNDDDD